jgi:dTDP-glucose 4,6-dehydratase
MHIVTGGAGFIGSNFVIKCVRERGQPLVNLDLLTYAGNRSNLDALGSQEPAGRHTFVHGDVADRPLVMELLRRHRPAAVLHFAAESHVDRSIRDPARFVDTNVTGTYQLLAAVRDYWTALPAGERDRFRFLHVSTDEVYGSLEKDEAPFTENHPFRPNSPYAATKAASDHLVRAFFHTYGLPTITTNCSNNYGPYQFPEKLIPLCVHNALKGLPLPLYGDGQQIRDWLYVDDHCDAVARALEHGVPGEVYNVGGWNEKTNLDVVRTLCGILDEEKPRADGQSYALQIAFVKDRPGHDRRYAIDAGKIERELGWRPKETFESGIRKTVRWYLDNQDWVENVTSGAYRHWVDTHYPSN